MVSIPQVIRTIDMPIRVCWKISDKAGNFADPIAFDFGPPALMPNALRNGASLERGTIAAGSAFRVDTFNLTSSTQYSPAPVTTLAGVRMSLVDAAGRTLPIGLMTAGPLYLEAVMPDAAAPGRATVIVQPPEGPALSQPVTIRATAAGLYSDLATGAPVGYASDSDGNVYSLVTCVTERQCVLAHLPISLSPGGLDLFLYATGVRNASGKVRLRIGTHTLESIGILRHPEVAGVDEAHFYLPPDFPLRLYQAVAVETPDGVSNYLWLYLE
jgi:uncharacterized protein (TIGR03437 family)